MKENMDKNMVDFVNKLAEDQALQERMSKAANPEEAYEIAKENGVTVSFDEFKETMKILAAVAKGELSEEEMKAVSGGMDGLTVVAWTGVGAATAAGIGAAVTALGGLAAAIAAA